MLTCSYRYDTGITPAAGVVTDTGISPAGVELNSCIQRCGCGCGAVHSGKSVGFVILKIKPYITPVKVAV